LTEFSLLTQGVLFWLEVLSYLLPFLLETDKFSTRLPAAGRRRMRLDVWDYYHIVINKLQIPFFFLTVVRFLYGGGNGLFHSINVVSDVSQLNVLNFAVAIVLQFIVYDFAYSLFHRFLHWPPVYAYVHKHHHRQVAPMRGLDDAINTHWFENFCGMWWHLMSIIIIDRLGFQQHSLSGVMFLVIGSMLSSFNHLSFDTKIPFGLYNASEHLTHHRFSKMNYGAYIQLWDRVFGTYVDWTTPPEITPEQGPVAPDYCSPEACLKEAKKITKDAPKRCVVTGGNGLVGKRLVEMLVERGSFLFACIVYFTNVSHDISYASYRCQVCSVSGSVVACRSEQQGDLRCCGCVRQAAASAGLRGCRLRLPRCGAGRTVLQPQGVRSRESSGLLI
jgi:sterol desaturase/sphingolipid hydroxylase (fatty acid hydroxylase superfamily)